MGKKLNNKHKHYYFDSNDRRRNWWKMELGSQLFDIKTRYCFVNFEKYGDSSNRNDRILYQLPDDKKIEIVEEVSDCCEIIFQPSMAIGGRNCLERDVRDQVGISRMLYNSIQKTDVDVRKELSQNIVCSGASFNIDGFDSRIKRELDVLLDSYNNINSNISIPQSPQYAVWRGGMLLASLSTFEEMYISKNEYNDSGPSIVHRKCY